MSDTMFLIAGPCSIEDDGTIALETALRLAEMGSKFNLPIIFKTSWHKANRTSGGAYRGVDIELACDIFERIKAKSGLPVTTDVHQINDVWRLRHYVDVLQVPALLSRQTDLLEACAKYDTGAVTIKKGPFIAPHDVRPMVEKVRAKNERKPVAVIERGNTFGYNNTVVDFRGFQIMSDRLADWEVPIVFDATHTVQYPQSGGDRSGGDRRLVAPLARAAAATGYCDGYFVECHPDPDSAKCDGPCMVVLDDMPSLIRQLIGAHELGLSYSDRCPRPLRLNPPER